MTDLPNKSSGGRVGDTSATTNIYSMPNATMSTTPAETPNASSTPQATTGQLQGQLQNPTYGKIAIPRARSAASPRLGRRVPRACESCRMRKTKCSGDAPVCRQCRELQVACVYPLGYREKIKRQQVDLQKKLRDSQSLLKEAEAFVPGRTAEKIREFLKDSDSGYASGAISNDLLSSAQTPIDEEEKGNPNSASSVGSLEAVDEVDYDVNRTDQSRAAGNLGKSSEITWMRRLEQDTEQQRKGHPGEINLDFHQSDKNMDHRPLPYELNYHLDDVGIGVSEPVQMYWMPPRALADSLFETYMRVAHPYFPIINRPLFCDQYRRFFDELAVPGDKWLAILNMIFAIAMVYANVAELEDHGNPQDHLLYLTRTRMLSMGGDNVFSHPDLQQVQIEGLIAFYLLSTDQVHRAWRISTLAIRSAVSLGINMKSNDHTLPNISREMRNRVWWSLFMVENRLGLMTGRPTCISVDMCSTPLPLPLGDVQLQESPATLLLQNPALREKRVESIMVSSQIRLASLGKDNTARDMAEAREWLHSLPVNAELCFLYACDLTILIQELLDRVYTVNSVHRPWSELKGCIEAIKSRVDAWRFSLPPGLDFTHIETMDEGRGEKTWLAWQYYSTQIMLGRPCLCGHDKLQAPSKKEKSFSHDMAVSAVKSAASMARLIPDGPDSTQIYGISSWWCLLHYVMQTVTILTLELSLECIHMEGAEGDLLQLAKRCVGWLNRASKHSFACFRAWQLCDSSLRRIGTSMGLDVSDLPSRPSRQTSDCGPNILGASAGQTHTQPLRDVPMSDQGTEYPFDAPDHPHPMPPSGPFIGFETENPLIPSTEYEINTESFFSDPMNEQFLGPFFR